MSTSTRKRAEIADEESIATHEIPGTFEVTAEAIAERAYALYLARGAEDGHDVEDWLRAEYELRSEALDRPPLTDTESAA